MYKGIEVLEKSSRGMSEEEILAAVGADEGVQNAA